jgi:uncharacterized membrane protein
VIVVIAAGGVSVSSYLTSVHYADTALICNTGGVVDCERVLTSSYSEVLGVPWSLGGIVWFAFSGLLAILSLARHPEPVWLHPTQLGWSLIGLATAIYLVGVEVVAVEKICLWCSSLHVLISLTLLLTLLRAPELAEGEPT